MARRGNLRASATGVAVLSLLLAGGPAARAEAVDPDVRGVHLGMTHDEVRAAMQAAYPGVRILEKRNTGALESLRLVHQESFGSNDAMTVEFTLPPAEPRAVAVQRSRTYSLGARTRPDRPGVSATREAVIEKYGRPTSNEWTYQIGGSLVWQLDPDRRPCATGRADARSFVVPGCSRILVAEISGANGLVDVLVIEVVDTSTFGTNRRAFGQWRRDQAKKHRQERIEAAPPPPEL